MRFKLITVVLLTIILAALVFTPLKAASSGYVPGQASGNGPYGAPMSECPMTPVDCVRHFIG